MTKGSLHNSGPQSEKALDTVTSGNIEVTFQESSSEKSTVENDQIIFRSMNFGNNVDNTTSFPVTENQNTVSEIYKNTHEINIAEYVQKLPQIVRNKIAGFFGIGVTDQSLIDIENIEHYLVVSRYSNPLKSACESKLLSTLTVENCMNYLKFAEQFDLINLRNSAWLAYKNNCANRVEESNPDKVFSDQIQSCECPTSHRKYKVIFTCDTTTSKRTISVVVLDSTQSVRCHRNIKKGDKISKLFQCCCIQDDEQHAPYVFWSFGSAVFRYDPILNKCKKRESLRHCRAKFSLVSCNQCLYAIGGESDGKTVRPIEVYDLKRKSWKVVAHLPLECNMSYSSCAVVKNLMYIFSGATSKENCCQNRTVVCVFNPVTNIIEMLPEIPMSFRQIKSCVLDNHIYLASEDGELIKYSPLDGNFIKCRDQLIKSKDFGMYSENDAIFVVGGVNHDGKCNNSIRKYCTKTGNWERLSKRLPDAIPVYGTCDIKIPNSCSIVPFYENKLFEISPNCV